MRCCPDAASGWAAPIPRAPPGRAPRGPTPSPPGAPSTTSAAENHHSPPAIARSRMLPSAALMELEPPSNTLLRASSPDTPSMAIGPSIGRSASSPYGPGGQAIWPRLLHPSLGLDPHPDGSRLEGTLGRVHVEEIQNPLTRTIRRLDKFIDALAQGNPCSRSDTISRRSCHELPNAHPNDTAPSPLGSTLSAHPFFPAQFHALPSATFWATAAGLGVRTFEDFIGLSPHFPSHVPRLGVARIQIMLKLLPNFPSGKCAMTQ